MRSRVLALDLRVHQILALDCPALHNDELGKPALVTTAGEHGHHVDGLGDQRAEDRRHSLLDEPFKPVQGSKCGTGVDGSDATGVTVPRCRRRPRIFPA